MFTKFEAAGVTTGVAAAQPLAFSDIWIFSTRYIYQRNPAFVSKLVLFIYYNYIWASFQEIQGSSYLPQYTYEIG